MFHIEINLANHELWHLLVNPIDDVSTPPQTACRYIIWQENMLRVNLIPDWVQCRTKWWWTKPFLESQIVSRSPESKGNCWKREAEKAGLFSITAQRSKSELTFRVSIIETLFFSAHGVGLVGKQMKFSLGLWLARDGNGDWKEPEEEHKECAKPRDRNKDGRENILCALWDYVLILMQKLAKLIQFRCSVIPNTICALFDIISLCWNIEREVILISPWRVRRQEYSQWS